MTARAAEYLYAKRRVMPSNTSLDDAAASATAAMVRAVAQWEYVLDIDTLPGARVREPAIRRHLAGIGWRAAFNSLTCDAGDGFTGRVAGEMVPSVSLALDAGQLASQAASLQSWARGERTIEESAPTAARRALCSVVGYFDFHIS
jgi:hypothetical protein